ncbi:MAG: trypsin-like peptidase domain-containing protein [Pirellulales bacterium]|nr:trypsin-like peptidase domain-containing protein [Pirellulales bacterium]
MYQDVADATYQIQCGPSLGSGFSFRSLETVVTNCHVIAPLLTNGKPAIAITESGQQLSLTLIASSPPNQHDFAIFKINSQIPAGRRFLTPKLMPALSRGHQVIFAGFPHGVSDLLVQEAIVSAPIGNHGFYLDGSVNGGNSGGPIVDKTEGHVLGIVTQRRFLGNIPMAQMRSQAQQLALHCQQIASGGSRAIMMGIDFTQFANMMAQGLLLIDEVLQANANSGIAIGFKIEFVNAEADNQRLN